MKLKKIANPGQGRTHPKESYGDISEVIPFTLGIIGGKEIPTIKARNLHALLAYLESRDCALLDMDMRTAERKERLTTLAARWLDECLGADHA